DCEVHRPAADKIDDGRIQIRHTIDMQVAEMQQSVPVELRRQVGMRESQLDEAEVESSTHARIEQVRDPEQNPEGAEQTPKVAPVPSPRSKWRVLRATRFHLGASSRPDLTGCLISR